MSGRAAALRRLLAEAADLGAGVDAQIDALETRNAVLENENANLLDLVHDLESKLGTAPTEPPAETTTVLAESIALAQAARKFGLTLVQARELFGAVEPAQAASISRRIREERDRAEQENDRRQARRSGE